MARKSKKINVSEMPGDLFPNLATAQKSAAPALASDLAATMRGLLARGILIVKDGKLQPNTTQEVN